MKNVHKLEIYSRDFKLKDFCAYDHESEEINADYLTLSSNTVSLPKIMNVQNGDYVFSVSGIQGVADAVEYRDGQTILTYKPLYSLLDADVYYDRSLLSSSLTGFFVGMIKNSFVDNADTTQNIPGLEIVSSAATLDVQNATLNIVDNINNIFGLLQKALKKYRLCVSIELLPYDKKIVVTLAINQNIRYIIAEKPYVLDSEIYIKPSNEGINKLIGYWKDNESDASSPYIVKKDDTQTVSKVFTKYYDGEDAEEFMQNVKDDSYELFSYDESSNYISVDINSESNLYAGYSIGDLGVILYDGTQYTAILTQIVSGQGMTRYVFGTIRLDLTDKLLLGGF